MRRRPAMAPTVLMRSDPARICWRRRCSGSWRSPASRRPGRARPACPWSTTMGRRCWRWESWPRCCAGSAPARAAASTRASCRGRMGEAQIWHARVQGYDDILADPQVRHMQALVTARGGGKTAAPLTLVNHPVRYDGEAATIRLPPQRLGAQTREVLAELGFAPAEIAALARDGVVRVDES